MRLRAESFSVMDALSRRSTDVTSTLTLPLTAPMRSRTTLDFEALYRASRDDVFAYVATLLRDRSAAEDVTAAAFERAYRKQGTYRAARGSERAWLFGIARNAALDELRRRRRSAAITADPEDVHAAAPEDEADLALRRTALRGALAGLPPRERELIALKFHAGLDNAELARVLGVSVSNAGTLLHRAVQKLRKAIDEHA
jgi:RNA polymerase sigma-70 factor, ECF subfamily